MSPHSQLLIIAATVGGAVVLAVGIMLGHPSGPPVGTGTDPTLSRVTVLDVDVPQAEGPAADDRR